MGDNIIAEVEIKTSKLATTSLILGLFSYSILPILIIFIPFLILVPVFSVLTGILSLRSIKKYNKKGKALALAGIIMSSVFLIIIFVIFLVFGGGNNIWS